MEAFANEIEAQPAPPCDEFKCERYTLCAVIGRACQAFVEYVETGAVRKPDFSDPAELPSVVLFYDRLKLRRPRYAQEKPKFNLPMRKITDG